jgi:hypothetical protein
VLQGYFMYVTNLKRFGHLVSADNFETGRPHDELYNLFENPYVCIQTNLLFFGITIFLCQNQFKVH